MSDFYTRAGDQGETGLLGKERTTKYSLRIETIGSLDETNAILGVVRCHSSSTLVQETILAIQKKLYQLMAEVAATSENADQFSSIDNSSVTWVESLISDFSGEVEIPNQFIIPGDTRSGAFLSLARTIIRRAERRVAEMIAKKELVNQYLLVFLNRLSSLCFVMELFENKINNNEKQTLVK